MSEHILSSSFGYVVVKSFFAAVLQDDAQGIVANKTE
jgi:hypothetical protein